MTSVKIRQLEIGAGMPKICVPIAEKTEDAVLKAARRIIQTSADLVEWRVDWFEEIFDLDKIQNVLGNLRKILADRPLLFTCRTEEEGGAISLSFKQYERINQVAIESGYVDLIDIELLHHPEMGKELIMSAQTRGIKVVGSNHDFYSTPEKEEMLQRLVSMQKAGADIVKIAVMPKDEQDVQTLLLTAKEITGKMDLTPLVAISMGEKGLISRIAAKQYGIAMTFGSVGNASAPGQIEVEELRRMMESLES